MKKLRSRIGLTMAEMLIVVGIIAVLSGVAFITVNEYRRSLGQLERDSIAKEIFVAAQNHLTAAFGEGYLGADDFGEQKESEQDEGVYYLCNNDASENSVLWQMLPFGSIDETVRAGGSYIVRYQKDTGLVLDVFYCTETGTPTKYNHSLSNDDYSDALDKRGDGNKAARRKWIDGAILGWYGGAETATLPTLKLEPPTIEVTNADKLYVTVTDPNYGVDGAEIQLIVEGLSSGAKKAFSLSADADSVRVAAGGEDGEYIVTLDDITSSNGLHFAQLTADSGTFIPGENLKIRAVASSTTKLANVAYSGSNTTNSLFGGLADSDTEDSNKTLDTAYISSVRHLENLDALVSNLGSADPAESSGLEKFTVSKAVQTSDMSWVTFMENTGSEGVETSVYYSEDAAPYTPDKPTTAGHYYPVSPGYVLAYDGQHHSISDVAVSGAADAGLFGATTSGSDIRNLELIDFTVEGTETAGALAGKLSGCTVTNVLARNSGNTAAANVTAPTAGGLVGETTGTTVQYSAAAVIVDGDTVAGGLVGSAAGTITGCYSGGHTQDGSYGKWLESSTHTHDVTGATAGGLVGSSSAAISNSYSTCSVSGTAAAGGFAGSAGGSIANCYSAGLVETEPVTEAGDRETNGVKGAFAGALTGSATDCSFFSAINEVKRSETKGGETTYVPDHFLGAVGDQAATGGIQPFDLNADTYNEFVGKWDDWNSALAFDSALVQYYSGRYALRTVDELNGTLPAGEGYADWNELFVMIHYGDWPSPEVFFINH